MNTKRKFGLEDIIPRATESVTPSFTLANILPRKPPLRQKRKPKRKPKTPQHIANYNQFYDNLRTAFAPFGAGPEWILNGPVKKWRREASQESLFTVEYAIEQYQAAHPELQAEQMLEDDGENLRGGEKSAVVQAEGVDKVLGDDEEGLLLGEKDAHVWADGKEQALGDIGEGLLLGEKDAHVWADGKEQALGDIGEDLVAGNKDSDADDGDEGRDKVDPGDHGDERLEVTERASWVERRVLMPMIRLWETAVV